jgi:hypothetical protein
MSPALMGEVKSILSVSIIVKGFYWLALLITFQQTA